MLRAEVERLRSEHSLLRERLEEANRRCTELAQVQAWVAGVGESRSWLP